MPPRPETANPLTPDSARVGRRIDHYQLVALIGRGTTGAVYRARDVRLGRTVAIKTATGTRDGARLTDRVRQRFLREAMALSKIDHRNVVRVLDYGFADDGTPFLVMEHLRGQDLAAALALADGPLPISNVADIGLGVCAALRACHRVGIIHRDLKPGNVFLAQTDTGADVKVLDFGVCRAASADDRTRAVPPAAPSHHLAPEQIDGKVGPASDQYALGVLLHLCLTRRLPEHPTLRDGRDTPDQLPAGLAEVLSRAMRVAPSDRFESVYALGRELLPFASERGQVLWRGYYEPRLEAPQISPASIPGGRRGVPTPTSVDAPAATTKTNASRRAAGEPRSRELPRPGTWPWRAASIGCMALAATEIGSATRSPPRSAPPPLDRRTASGQQTPGPRPDPSPTLPAPRGGGQGGSQGPTPPVAPILVSAPAPAPVASSGHRLPPRRAPIPSPPPPPPELPTIDPAGVGIPTE
ncbi:MAG TPA: serine/threonine-protein kinase [Polyangia bacterium]|nr:serine/threonine-protein kinase [Polyangia bacterium]